MVALAITIQQSRACTNINGNRTRTWPDYAPDIFARLQRALATINQTIRPGDDHGHAGRFFALLVPQMTGETPKPSTCARYLRSELAKMRIDTDAASLQMDSRTKGAA